MERTYIVQVKFIGTKESSNKEKKLEKAVYRTLEKVFPVKVEKGLFASLISLIENKEL